MDDLAARSFYSRYNACCNAHRFDDLSDFVDPGVVINGTVHGLQAYAEGLWSVVRAFPDYRWRLRHLAVDGVWVAAHLDDTGTHRDTFFEVAATGRTVNLQEFAFYRLAENKIVEVWGMAFGVQLLEQIRHP